MVNRVKTCQNPVALGDDFFSDLWISIQVLVCSHVEINMGELKPYLVPSKWVVTSVSSVG